MTDVRRIPTQYTFTVMSDALRAADPYNAPLWDITVTQRRMNRWTVQSGNMFFDKNAQLSPLPLYLSKRAAFKLARKAVRLYQINGVSAEDYLRKASHYYGTEKPAGLDPVFSHAVTGEDD